MTNQPISIGQYYTIYRLLFDEHNPMSVYSLLASNMHSSCRYCASESIRLSGMEKMYVDKGYDFYKTRFTAAQADSLINTLYLLQTAAKLHNDDTHMSYLLTLTQGSLY
ncbi:hypothetical protein SIL08_17895 [Scandinavium sp. V105_16]|uniref:Uncharacterized protein n=1 Tax=Scandinavium lactucae TaxID=3095028 RepID=A0AAJ2SC13_9ENTR|nr:MULTISPECIES: hypothetical protein [unclassified Scandinavium]MDX6022150.1 hypothetical protein [Scandinavium sp. V105_16]MDX6034008.1 hypothetical protein [Scandinavium sp. V105_12]MDX6042145.1 hypothetical protein [Scandinavium sp. V105_6]MDX6052146.1 hypothetical protein [Scandinavium sp. V105_1]